MKTKRTAKFSEDRRYRYDLIISWGKDTRYCNFLMLNPSTADEVANDPTVERCERRARAWGYDGLVVTNIFAFRSTDPAGLRSVDDPIGAENDKTIVWESQNCPMTICAWGSHGKYLHRGEVVLKLLRNCNTLYYLRLGKTGEPTHPLYLPYELEPVLWKMK